jgi:hypothetical protein
MYMFNAGQDPHLPQRVDHTNLVYHTGLGFSMSIDPVYRLLWHGMRKQPGVGMIERHYDHLVSYDMRTVHHLQPMPISQSPGPNVAAGWPDVWGLPGYRSGYQDAENMLHVMQSEAVFDEAVRTQSGDIVAVGAFWGERLRRVINVVRAQVPTSMH